MKIESPLEVLSRAASIVQNEEKTPVPAADTKASQDDEILLIRERKTPSPISSLILTTTSTAKDSFERRSSPKRQLHSSTEKSFKKLKLEDERNKNNNESRLFESHLKNEMTTTTYTCSRPLAAVNIWRDAISKEQSAPPPLIAINNTTRKFPPSPFATRKLPEYEVLFPRPSVIASTAAPSDIGNSRFRYHYRCAVGCNCGTATPTAKTTTTSKFHHNHRHSSAAEFLKKSTISSIISRDFELPTVDDHFRKSLGDKYDFTASVSSFHERPSSVDDHFAKALGKNWYSLSYSKCASS